jgi:hypothetical protein
MSSNAFPEDIARFIADRIDSVAELEALLILRQSAPSPWDARTLAGRLYIGEAQADSVLRALCDKGLAKLESGSDSQYQYCPASRDLGLTLDGLARIYPTHIVPVTKLIHSKPKVHRVQGFADAFRFRKDD